LNGKREREEEYKPSQEVKSRGEKKKIRMGITAFGLPDSDPTIIKNLG
jgi:hypothetical protein